MPGVDDVTAAPCIERLLKRADFLRAAQSRRQPMPGFLLQARARDDTESVASHAIRLGFTCSRKVGNAVARNRAKRRLRALAQAVMPEAGRAGWDYVLVGRPEATATRDFALMRDDLSRALARVHADRAPGSAPGGAPGSAPGGAPGSAPAPEPGPPR
jgi:ribonuclease P protein component